MDRIKKQELLAKMTFEEQFSGDEEIDSTFYFVGDKELLKEFPLPDYPEATAATLALSFDATNNSPEARDVSVHISPTTEEDDGSLFDYDWRDIELDYSEIEKLLDRELNSRPYLLVSVCEGEILTERFRYLEDARHCMIEELCDASKQTLEDFPDEKEYEDDDYKYGYSYVDNCAYVREGVNHSNYDWRIIKLF